MPPLLLLTGLGLCLVPAQGQPLPVTEGKITVSDVIIQGNRLTPTEYIKNQMKTRVGREYVPETLQEDVRNLYATRLFANVWADRKDDGPRRVKVHVYVRDFASTVQRVTFTGCHALSRDDLEPIAKVYKGAPLNPAANRLACRAILQRYQEEGRPFASCELLRGGADGDQEVIFSITEGPKVKITSIGFTGHTFVHGPVLKNHIDSTSTILGLGGTYNAAMVENDVHQLVKYYRSFGYHDVRINRELIFTGDGSEAKLIFHIREGARYRVAATPRIVGVKPGQELTLQAFCKVRAGDYYDEGKVNGDTGRIRDYFGYRGYDVRATAEPVFSLHEPGLVRLIYEVARK
jgi:outer membrane protein insertion porin family